MKLAYIILAHTAPDHLCRLVEKLGHENDCFFIHIDAKKDIAIFKKTFTNAQENVKFIAKRENGQWGDLGIVKATINAMREIIETKINYDQIILLSGAGYPIKSTKFIRHYYHENQENTFISYEKMPISGLNFGGKNRILCYSFNFRNRRETFIPFRWNNSMSSKGKLFNALLGVLVLFKGKRKIPFANMYSGSQWWSMSFNAMSFTVNYLNENPDYMEYHKDSLLPDEMFFQSLLLNVYPFKDKIINDNLRFIEFDSSSSHPKEFTKNDFSTLINSNQLFARKFIPQSEILDLIDSETK